MRPYCLNIGMLFYLTLLSSVLSAAVVQDLVKGDSTSLVNEGPLAELSRRSSNPATLENPASYSKRQYFAQYKLGSTGQTINVSLDTGSYTLVFNANQYNPSKSETSFNTTNHFKSCYGDGSWCAEGYQFTDNLVTESGLNASSFHFSLDESSNTINFVGLAPRTDSQGGNSSLINQLYQKKQIESRSFSLWLSGGVQGGKIIYGGVDHTKYTGNLGLVPMQVDKNGNPSANTYVRRVWAYNQCGERAVVYEGVTGLGFDSGNSFGYLPKTLVQALAIAFNVTLVKDHPEAMREGFNRELSVVKYMGGGGYILDIHGVELKIDIRKFLTDARGDYVDSPEIGKFYHLGLPSSESGTTFELGIPTFFESVYYIADWDRKQFAFAQASGPDSALASSDIEPIGSVGIPSATTAPYYSETVTVATPSTYSTNIFRTSCPASTKGL